MTTRVRLFVSAGPDQEPARELMGRVLAELPVNVGWLIKRTPDVDAVAESHLFAILLGTDIWAPVGLELWWAQRTEKPVVAYRADVLRTPAAQAFLHDHAMLDWQRFADFQQLRRAFSLDLGRFLVTHAERYGLTLIEAELLREFLTRLDRPAPAAVPTNIRGAGGGGVILAPGKDQPVGARLVPDQGA
jgi:hypothetical protein